MMLLSRFWYAILAVALAAAVGLLYISIREHNRLRQADTYEIVNHDQNIVDWFLQLDARRRLDGLAIVAFDTVVQNSVATANGQEKIDPTVRATAQKKLAELADKLRGDAKHPGPYREESGGPNPIILFAVDAHGRVVGQVNFDRASQVKEDQFELGGFPVVNEALHGWMRDDTWVFDRDTIYRVVARPVVKDQGGPPVGAVVAARRVDDSFAHLVASYTNAPVAFYVHPSADPPPKSKTYPTTIVGRGAGEKQSGLWDGFVLDESAIDGDAYYADSGVTSLKSDPKTGLAVIYARLYGEGWSLGAGYAVARKTTTITDPNGVLSNATTDDKKAVPIVLVGAIAFAALLLGFLATWVEHTIPTSKLVREARKFGKGEQDALRLAKLSGPLRRVGQDVNEGIEKVIAKGGGASRKAADLEQILGPVPAAPQMSAFSFNLDKPPPPITDPHPAPAGPDPFAGLANLPPAGGVSAGGPPGPPPKPAAPTVTKPDAPVVAPATSGLSSGSMPRVVTGTGMQGPTTVPRQHIAQQINETTEDDEATQVARIPDEIMRAAATGEARAIENADEILQWRQTFDEFVSLRKKCNESTAGLSFEKFQVQLRKNKEQLVKQYGCRRVKFTVYEKDGKAALKATPIKE